MFIAFLSAVILTVTLICGYFIYSYTEIKGAESGEAFWTEEAVFNESDYTSFAATEDFTLLCVSDMNLAPYDAFFGKARKKLAALSEKTSPDLIVFNGNLTRSNLSAPIIKTLSKSIVTPWVFTFGKNDNIGPQNKDRIIELATKKGNLKMRKGNPALGAGTNLFLLKNTEGKTVQAIFLFDSGPEKRPAQALWHNWAIGNLNSVSRVPEIIFLSDSVAEDSAFYTTLDKTFLTHIFTGGSRDYSFNETAENVYIYLTMPFCGAEAGATKINIRPSTVSVDFFKFD